MAGGKNKQDLSLHYATRVAKQVRKAPWVLRVTVHKDKPVPVLVIKERIHPDQRTDTRELVAPRSVLRERGLIYGDAQRRCLPVIRGIVEQVCDEAGIPLELHRFLGTKRIPFRGNLPLDAEAGYKLALLFKLQERIHELDRVELIARRIARFSREEAGYWHSRISTFGEAANRWALAGMKRMLGGQPRDPHIETMLQSLRSA